MTQKSLLVPENSKVEKKNQYRNSYLIVCGMGADGVWDCNSQCTWD